MAFVPLEVYLAPDDEHRERRERFIDFPAFPPEIRFLVYKFIFRHARTFGLEPLRPIKSLFDGNYTHYFSTILQTSSQTYHEAHPFLYSENKFAIRAVKDCFKPFDHPLLRSNTPTTSQLRDLTVHVVKLSNIKTIWKTICQMNLKHLTLDFGNDGDPSVGTSQGTHDPMRAIAQVLHLTKTSPESDLPEFRLKTKTVKQYRAEKYKGLAAHQAFARAEKDAGTAGRCPKASKVLLKAGLTAVQLSHIVDAASGHVAGWQLKEIQDEEESDDDAEDKENWYQEKTFLWLKQ